MDIDKIKKSTQTETLQIRVDKVLKQAFIEACEQQGFSYSVILRAMIKDFINNKYININDSTLYELHSLAELYNISIDDVLLKTVKDKYDSDIINGNNK